MTVGERERRDAPTALLAGRDAPCREVGGPVVDVDDVAIGVEIGQPDGQGGFSQFHHRPNTAFGLDMHQDATGGLTLAAMARQGVGVIEMAAFARVEGGRSIGIPSDFHASVRVDALDRASTASCWRTSPASSAFGNAAFGRINNQANNMRMVQFTFRFQF